MTPVLMTHDGMVVLGIDATTSNADERDPSRARIPALWARFFKDEVLSAIPGKKAPVVPVGVYTSYESDHDGRYRVIAGTAVDESTPVPEGLASVTVPAGRYLVFKGEGVMPDVVVQTWMAVWRHFSEAPREVRAYTADFEIYRGPNAVDIYVAVR
jgi:predicted transcriptional regulator YdeE